MYITVTSLEDLFVTLNVSEELELENFKVLCEMETGVPASEIAIFWNGRPLHDGKLTLRQYGLKHEDRVLMQHIPGQIAQDFGNVDPVIMDYLSQLQQRGDDDDDATLIREILLNNPGHLAMMKVKNPTLASALLSGDAEKFRKVFNDQKQAQIQEEQERIRLIQADPFDPHAQHLIEEAIRLRNVESNMATAMEYAPESFAQVHMLYIDCKVNGQPVKAFVDSGAQMTIMSQACAERCHIMRLVDKRWAGEAKGVGTQTIIGRVHLCQIQIGGAFLQSSFSILESQIMDMLLGLDMLRRHQCVIDLKKNQLEIGTTGTFTPFLSEAELPESARLSRQINFDTDKDVAGTSKRSYQDSNRKSPSKKASTSHK